MELSLRLSLSLHHHRTTHSPNSLSSLPSYSSLNNYSFPCFSTRLFSSSNNFRHVTVCTRAVEIRKADKEQFPACGVRVTESKQPNSSVKLSVEVSPRVSSSCYKSTLDKICKPLNVNGFRPGQRLPDKLLENIIGKDNIHYKVIEAILKKTFPHAMDSIDGRALEDSVDITNTIEELSASFSLSSVFKYEILVDVVPVVRWRVESRYKDLKIVVEIDDVIDAKRASEIDFKRRHKSLGVRQIVSDRGLQVGDLVVLDMYGESIEEGESTSMRIPSVERKGFQLDTEEHSNMLPGLLDSIIGIQQGETRSFLLEFPQSWEQKSLRGVQAKFTVECKELFYRELPPLDDSIAGRLFPGCSTLNEVKELILEKCTEVEKTAIEQATDNAILDHLGKLVKVVIPQFLIEEQGRQLYGTKLLQLQVEGSLDESQLELLMSEDIVREYLETERDHICSVIRQMLAIGEIFQCENLQFSTDKLVKEVEKSVAEFKRHNQEYDEDRVKHQVQNVLEGEKVLEWLKANSRIEYAKK